MISPRRMIYMSNMAVVALFLLTGCNSTPPRRPALHFDPAYLDPKVSVIHIMPVLDARLDRTVDFNSADLSDLGEQLAYAIVEYSGYRVETVERWPAITAILGEEILSMSPEQLCGLAPDNCHAFFVLMINNIESKHKALSTSYSITGTAMLVNREKGKLIWKNIATGSYSSAGLIPAWLDKAQKKKASAKANLIWRLLGSFPAKSSM
ncbi:MAG: hypothetical protein JW715_02160 [Sedimentisphaerales bacterium]|nr:hypothetical protein [Sedimentisphaerales bacterium]